MNNRLKNIQPITVAIQNNNNLKEAVDQTLISLPETGMRRLLLELMKASLLDERYMSVFDILHEKYPESIVILKSKALILKFDYPRETIRTLSKALFLLHQREGYPQNIYSFYIWIGRELEKLKEYHRAIAAYTLAISHYWPGKHTKNICHKGHYLRARLYIKTQQNRKAKKGLLFLMKHYPEDTEVHQMLDEIENNEVY